MSTLAGPATGGTAAAGHVNGAAESAKFDTPLGVAVDGSGRIFVADAANHRIRLISGSTVSVFAGNGEAGATDAVALADSTFNTPSGVAAEASGVLYVADAGNGKVRKIVGTTTSTLTGTYNNPVGVAVGPDGKVYVAEMNAHRISVIDGGSTSVLAGSGVAGFRNDTGPAAQFRFPTGVAVDASGNVYVADYGNQRIRKITSAGVVTTLAGTGMAGFANGAGASAMFNSPYGVALDVSSNVYVAEELGHRIRKVTPAGVVSTYAGAGQDGLLNGGGATARFSRPKGVTIFKFGSLQHLLVVDTGNHNIRMLTPAP